jgi:hypothetical protein
MTQRRIQQGGILHPHRREILQLAYFKCIMRICSGETKLFCGIVEEE